MKLSVIIPWHDNGDEWRRRSWHWLCDRYHALLPEAEILWGGESGDWTTGAYVADKFNRSAARNFLADKATGDFLLFADADTVFQRSQIVSGIAMLLSGRAPWVIPYGAERYYNLTADETALVWRCAADAGIPEPSDPRQWDHKITSWAGLLLVPRAAFDKVGGYDENFRGWGYEDNAFRVALDRVVGEHKRCDGPAGYALHLWHPAPDDQCFGQPDIQHNRDRCRMYETGLLP